MDIIKSLGELCRDKVVYTRLNLLDRTEWWKLPHFSREMVSNIRGEYFAEAVRARRRTRRGTEW